MSLPYYSRERTFPSYEYSDTGTMDELHLLNTVRHGSIGETRKDECRIELMKRWQAGGLSSTETKKPTTKSINDTLVEDLLKDLL